MEQEHLDAFYRERTAVYYDEQSTGLPGDAAFYVEEARRAGSPVLELGCGTGRILIPIAEAGVEIVGLDASRVMLDIAREKLIRLGAGTRNRIELVEGDMRDFALERRFRLILIPFRAFLHLLTSADQRRALHTIREHLTDDGRLVFNIFDPRIEIIGAYSGPLGGALKKLGEFTHARTGNQVIVWDTRRYDSLNQVVHEDRIYEEINAHGQTVARTHATLTLRYLYRYEMQYLLELCGFEVESLYGDFERGAFQYGGEQVWIARPRS
jgi:SAM-dependent methyltransferase